MKAKIIRVSQSENGPVPCFRPGEIVEVKSIETIPINSGPGTPYKEHKEAECVSKDGIVQYVSTSDLEFLSAERRDEVYIDGTLVGWTDTVKDVQVGKHCQGYFVDDCGRIAFDLDNQDSPAADITGFNDGTYVLDIGGGPYPAEDIVNLLEDVLCHIKTLVKP